MSDGHIKELEKEYRGTDKEKRTARMFKHRPEPCLKAFDGRKPHET